MRSLGPVPKLEAFPNGTPMSTVFDALYRDGAVVIQNLLSTPEIASVSKELQPHFDAEYNSGLDVFANHSF